MSFRDNLLKKIEIKQLSRQVLGSIVPNDSSKRIDLESMRRLLELGPYHYHKVRDLDLYCENENEAPQKIIVLDNELKTYHSSIEDVALRKSPTIKEMISIRNAIKILNDKAVVIRRKADTVQDVRSGLINALDLSFSTADIDALVKDGSDALKNNYAEGVVAILALFAELLDYHNAPKTFQMLHHQIWAKRVKKSSGEIQFGPMILFSLMRNRLTLVEKPLSSSDKAGLKRLQQIGKGDAMGDINGEMVFESLKGSVLANTPAPRNAT